MKKVLQLIAFAAVVYFGITRLIPWIESQGEGMTRSGSATELSESQCVDLARRATDTFSNEIRRYRPPIDEAAWNDSLAKIEDRIYAAESSCSCARASCDKATMALSSLSGLLSGYDGAFRGGGMLPLNAARELDGIFDQLNEAGGLARDGD